MSTRARTRLLAASSALGVTAAVVGWWLYFREKQRADALAARLVASEPDSVEQRSAREAARYSRARMEMHQLERAVKTYYTKTGEWPEPAKLAAQIEPLLKSSDVLQSPWPRVRYEYRLVSALGADGQAFERPVFTCQPPDGQPAIQWPER